MDATSPKTPPLDFNALMAALQHVGEGVIIFDADHRPQLMNQAYRSRFPGLAADFDNGATMKEAMANAARRYARGMTEEQIIEGGAASFARFLRGEVTISPTETGGMVRITNQPLPDGRRAVIAVDITEMTRRERDLEQATKAAEAASLSKSSFLANMSHEIRTPLNGIMGMAQVMEGTPLNQAQKEFLATILDSSRTLMALLNDVLDLSKIEAGKFDIVSTDANLQHILRRQLKLWKPRAEEKNLDLTLSFDADLPAYLAFDTVRVQQCVSNLVSNAIKFTAKGRVDIYASAKEIEGGHLVEIRVTDTGPGMDAATLGRLFQAFSQADETIQRQHGGTGLGLSITRRLAEMMGGSATAASEPGRGSTFRISFKGTPARNAPEDGLGARAASADEVRESLRQSNLRVLLVDDHPINRQVASLFLRPLNVRITEAANGAEALEALRREAFDLVLLDMHMPVMDGPSCVAAIRASREPWAGIPVIALTADAMSGDRERYLAMGNNGYLSKPLAERDLLSEIARVRSGAPPMARTLARAS